MPYSVALYAWDGLCIDYGECARLCRSTMEAGIGLCLFYQV